jgi:hypothetical protein
MRISYHLILQGVSLLCMALISCKEVHDQPVKQTNRVVAPQRKPESIPYTNTNIRSYVGAWFTIHYPSDFIVHPSMPSSTSADGFDSARFTSPDGLVEFYVFSPQWDGQAYDIELKPESEYLFDKELRNLRDKTEILFTIAAKDGSYKRSYRETTMYQSNVRWILGIKYASQMAYQKYQDAFVRFKKSLTQYAD